MSKKVAKKLVRNFYFLSLLINIVLPWMLVYINIGDIYGEANLIYIFVMVWALVNLLLYTIYFTIPDYKKNWEKIATFLFPSFWFILGIYYTEFTLLLIPFVINLVFNITCMLYYMHVMRKTV
ncbi:hypothetical protein [Kordia sp.]|uniref:hypothetical protein n=1 Tax=Kordia sp. TaxID=1965332 RepID=UPI003B590A9C